MKPCKHLDVKPDAAGRLVVRKDYGYKCMFPVPDFESMVPPALSNKHGIKYPETGKSTVFRSNCEKCPFYDPDRSFKFDGKNLLP